jgi:UDP-hydrolysing UDP-N-acetyl-D-glucosamine 2-epimerase
MKDIAADPALRLQVAATGMHLSHRFGHTVDVIARDGFAVDARIPFDLEDSTPAAIARQTGLAMAGFVDAFAALAPDVVVVLGDRFEILAAAEAAALMHLPLAHIHGGELTEGMLDDAIRHAISKMAHLHFPAADAYARRLMQMGESPERIHMVGAPGLDHLTRTPLLTRAELEERLGFSLSGGPLLLVTYHPTTLGHDHAWAADQLVRALQGVPDARIVLTGVNADPGNRPMRERFERFAAETPGRVLIRESLGQQNYLSTMRLADAVVGNSSSGLIEAPAVRVPTINIGSRQDGRLKAASVVDCGEDAAAIASAIAHVLDPAFRAALPAELSLYGQGDASRRIKDVLASAPLDKLLVKRFHDL